MVLYRLGRFVHRARRWVVAAWLVVLVGLLALAGVAGGTLEDDFSVPGTESQRGLEQLETRFPELAGATGQLVFSTTDGSQLSEHAADVTAVADEAAGIESVAFVQDPFDEQLPGEISQDGTVAIAQVQLDGQLGDVTEGVTDELTALAERSTAGSLEVLAGGPIFAETTVPVTVTEVVGVALALVVLAITFRGLLAAGMPILTAVVGVGVSMAGILLAARVTTLSSTTPTLSIMLGLAVGIDYALFILSRHRSQLAQGMSVEESVARAVATAGSAVLFAGTTVIIALAGLFIVGMPFLTAMGLAAAGAVAVAVLVAVTLLPALLAMLGERLRPRPGSAAQRLALPVEHDASEHDAAASEAVEPKRRRRMSERWIRGVVARPWLAVVGVVLVVAAMAVPFKDLALGLPDAGSEPEGSSMRESYDRVTEAFGPGYSTPLLLTADIINTTDPLGVMDGLRGDIEALDGVESVGVATPNPTADLGIVQVVPRQGQAHPDTAALVHDLRELAPTLEDRYGISDVTVTGQTAVAIDLSERLFDALLPFGLFVVGLSVLLLTLVFRSLWVPLTAAAGFILSILAAFGATSMVFIYGWGNSALGINQVGPVISFMPIIVMGVLFGLAMDYQVFLVSRMREDYVHTGLARRSVISGFTASARVVTAAALIMIAVFGFFVPESMFAVQPIALALAVGVAVDAFLVRMTLIPAVLHLLGDRAWRLPGPLERHLPSLDVEGVGLEHHLAYDEWRAEHGERTVLLRGVSAGLSHRRDDVRDLDLEVRPGEVLDLVAPADAPDTLRAVLGVLTGRLALAGGSAVVAGHVLPDESSRVAAGTQVVRDATGLAEVAALDRPPALVVLDRPGALDSPAARDALVALARDGATVVLGRLETDPGLPASDLSVVRTNLRAPDGALALEGAHR